VEIAIPFTSISLDNDVLKPQDLSYWRLNFSRVEWNHDVKAGKYSRQKNANGEGFLPEYKLGLVATRKNQYAHARKLGLFGIL